MSDTPAPSFDHFDRRIADALIAANNTSPTGLPKYLGAQFVEITPGRLKATLEVRDELITPLGSLHGGVMAGLVDHLLGCVLYPLMQRGQWAATTEFKINYLAAVRGGTLVAESTVVALTKRTAVVRVEVTNDGRLACMAQGTVLVVDPPTKQG
jgi:1,4-dihydroxy-2-naphthoyl-CoA hydrolase